MPDRKEERATIEKRVRAIASELLPDRLIDDLEVNHLLRVLFECALLPDVYDEERLARILGPSADRSPIAELLRRADAPSDVVQRVRRMPDDVRLVGDKALFDVGVSGKRSVRGYDLLHLGARAYGKASEALELLAEDRVLREFFKDNKLLVLPLEEEAVFLRQCSDRFGMYAELLQRIAGSGIGESLAEVQVRVPLMAAAAEALRSELRHRSDAADPAADQYLEAALPGPGQPRSREAMLTACERRILFTTLDLDRLRAALESTVIDQPRAVGSLIDDFSLFAAGTRDPFRPPAYFLVGPTGVGKNYLVESLRRALERLWQIELPLLTIEGPSYTYPADINELRGATRGFIRSDEEGVLTAFHERSSKAPLAILLVDEVEKAHPQLRKYFLSILDRGTTTDNRGNVLDFSNCLVFFTSNIGYSKVQQGGATIGYLDDEGRARADGDDVRRELTRVLSPEFLNRLRLVHFDRLTPDGVERILDIELARIAERYAEQHDLRIELAAEAREELIRRGFSSDYGARHLTRTLESVCNVDLAKRIRSDDRREPGEHLELIEWLREIRAGQRPFDADEVQRRVTEFARARLDYRAVRIVLRDGEFAFEPLDGDA